MIVSAVKATAENILVAALAVTAYSVPAFVMEDANVPRFVPSAENARRMYAKKALFVVAFSEVLTTIESVKFA